MENRDCISIQRPGMADLALDTHLLPPIGTEIMLHKHLGPDGGTTLMLLVTGYEWRIEDDTLGWDENGKEIGINPGYRVRVLTDAVDRPRK